MGVRLRLEVEAAFAKALRLLPRWWMSYGDGAGYGACRYTGQPPIAAGGRALGNDGLKAPMGTQPPWFRLRALDVGAGAGHGYVRTGSNDLPPVWLGSTRRHLSSVRAKRCAMPSCPACLQCCSRGCGQVRVAGVGCPKTGDQRAIDRADWDVLATGVAHLMSISSAYHPAYLLAALAWRPWCRSPRLCLAVPALCGPVAGAAGAYALFSGWGPRSAPC